MSERAEEVATSTVMLILLELAWSQPAFKEKSEEHLSSWIMDPYVQWGWCGSSMYMLFDILLCNVVEVVVVIQLMESTIWRALDLIG